MINIRPVVSAPLAACCTILSVFGVVILFAFGALFARHAEALVGSEESPGDPGFVARLCYLAGFVYLGFMVFCGLQMVVHNRYPRGVQL